MIFNFTASFFKRKVAWESMTTAMLLSHCSLFFHTIMISAVIFIILFHLRIIKHDVVKDALRQIGILSAQLNANRSVKCAVRWCAFSGEDTAKGSAPEVTGYLAVRAAIRLFSQFSCLPEYALRRETPPGKRSLIQPSKLLTPQHFPRLHLLNAPFAGHHAQNFPAV